MSDELAKQRWRDDLEWLRKPALAKLVETPGAKSPATIAEAERSSPPFAMRPDGQSAYPY